MSSKYSITILLLVLVMAACSVANVDSATGEALAAALEAKLPGFSGNGEQLALTASQMMFGLHEQGIKSPPSIFVEYDGSKPRARVRADIPEGTLGEQLNGLAGSIGYAWQPVGNWISLTPKDKANDAGYIMNQRIPGKVVVSRDSRLDTSIKEWLAAHRISCARDMHGLRFDAAKKRYGSDPVELDNPTLREYCIARSALYGYNVATVEITLVPEEGIAPRILITEWGHDTRGMLAEP